MSLVELKALSRADYEFQKTLQANTVHASKLSVLDEIVWRNQLEGRDVIIFGQDGNPPPQPCHNQVANYWTSATYGFEFVLTTIPHPTKANWVIVQQIDMS